MPVPETTPRRAGEVLELIRMRCRRCRGPWCRTPDASRACPFCGHHETVGALEVLKKALRVEPLEPRRRPTPLEALFAGRRSRGGRL